MTKAININNLTVRYGDLIVLQDVNLHINQQEIVSIVGPNGGGKTTLLKAMLGFKSYSGNIEVMGYTPKKLKNMGLVGYLPQYNSANYNFPVNVYDVVAFSRVAKKSVFQGLNNEDKSIIQSSLARVEMSDFADSHFGSLSGGQRQRILIARALALQPKILVLDEPSTGLDSVAQDSFYRLLVQLRDDEKLTIVMVTHDVGAVSVIVDRIACLNRKIHFHGDPHKLSNKERQQIFGENMNIVLHDEHCESCLHDRRHNG